MTTPVVVELRADGRGVVSAFRSTREEAGRLEDQIDRNTRSTRRMNRTTESATARFGRFRAAATAAIAALGVRQVARMADEMTLLNARLRLVTEGQEAFNAAQESVTRIANENGTALGAVSELYTRLAQSSTDLRDNQEELDTITQAITQSMRVSGANASESAGAIRQLSQAFASGVLRGDEFNSVNEQAPRLLQAVADSLEKERGELRALAEQGELTSEILREALVGQAEQIAEEAAQIPQTMGQAVQVVQNNLLRLVSALDTATGGTGSVTSFINRIGDAVESLVVLIEENYLEIQLAGIALGQAFATMAAVIGAAIQGVEATVTELVNRITNQYKEASAELFEFIAGIQEQRAQVAGLIPGLGDLESSLKGQAFAYRATAKATRQTMAEEQDLSEVLGRVAFELKERLGTIEDNASAMVDDAIAAAQAKEELEGLAEGQDAAADAAKNATELTDEQIESIQAFDGAIADLRAKLDGPAAVAIRDFNKATLELEELLAAGEITGRQFVAMLELQEEQFNRTQRELAQGLQSTLEELAFGTLPPVIQQMLGLADATGRVADSAQRAGALSQIGSNFSRAVLNGQSVGDSISSAFTGAGGQALSETIEEGFKNAFENLEFDDQTLENLSGGFALAIGQAVEGNVGQAAFTAAGNLVGEKIGSSIGEELGAFGGAIGSIIGSIIGDALFGDSVAKFQVRGGRSNTATDAGTDRTIGTAFGADLQIAFRGIEDQAKRQIVRGYSEFLNALSGVVRDPAQQSAIANVISRSGISSRSGPDDIEGQLELLFGDILGTFDGFTQDFVRQAETLDGQVQRLDDLLRLDNLAARGRDFGLTFEQLATVLDEVAIGGESIIDTFERLEPAVNALQRAADLTGNAFADSAQGLVRFSSELVAIFGDDAGAFSGVLNRVLEAAFSDEQLAQQTIDAARQRATDLLTGLGIAVSEETFTQGGLQDLLNDFLGAFDAEGTAQLLEAGDAIATLIDAQGQLADSSNAAADAQQRLADQQAFLRDVGQQALQVIAPSRAAFGDLIARLEQTRLRAKELEIAEGDLNIVRLAAAAQTLQLVAALEERLESSIDEFTGQDVQSGFDQVQSGISNTRDAWLRAIDSIQSALDAQLVGPNSSLTNRGRLNELESQLGEAVQGALSGDVGAAQQVSQLFQQAIAQGASFFGSTTDDFANFEQRLRELVGSVPGNVTIPPEQQTAANTQRIADSAATREQSDLERLQAAINIVDTLGILSEITGTLPSEISDRLPIAGIIEALTGEVPDLTGQALSGFFDELVFETSQQLNELARIEQVQIDQLSVMGDANDILRGIFDRMGGLVNGLEQFAGAVTEASGTIGGDVDFGPGGGGPALAEGGIVTGPTRALIGEAGPEAVIPLQRISDNRGIERRLERIEAALLTGNADRRDGTEIMVERQEQSLRIQERKRRTDKADILRPGNPQRARV